jgi:hypothetical protein
MSTETSPQRVPDLIDLEYRILRTFCTEPPAFDSPDAHRNPYTRATILATLRAHRWQNPEHRVVFEALTLLPGRQAADLREQLPAQATRMGFPDVNWDHYFAASADNAAIETLVAQLLAACPEEKP